MKKVFLYIFIVFSMFFLSACHSDYVTLYQKPCDYSRWSDDNNSAAFVLLTKATLAPTGLATFPDGGMPKPVYSDIALYLYKNDSKKIERLIDLNDLKPPEYIIPYCGKYKLKIIFVNNDLIYYHIHSRQDRIPEDVKNKYNNYFSYNIKTKKIQIIDKKLFDALYTVPTSRSEIHRELEYNYAQQKGVREILSKISTKERGLEIQEIYPSSNNEYMMYIIEKEGSALSRQMITEQILPILSKEEKLDMLDKIKKKKEAVQEKAKEKDWRFNDKDASKYCEYLDRYKSLLNSP